ncbi:MULTISPECIES: tripartite tricarboxylate transporter substrate binding protein [unclassified Cupriavidus]|uniref:Bug family tripartite tricarboxylate transporter substrate binding protein n=1 Tax=unclassified Cupriavidus TaxID=2640874 RepID=UPI001C008851|nr:MULTISPECIES: tripartite tricarboxylate transporter substrate binding protein [unclassified Cupriavidus]MCA3188419.1 tripartite tricarboxylate transporter substrate binding protein [Cupriavidus sp.]MCA3192469.1 tripartite tricarboxylate transporter substrate binding protein [Cupriavidus sp.]MCA3198919.1 tripartite tricarboxylate transporter substrate binding protein [Cupriavidus sp.]MCA3205281.1 tripartite tricarboxylate transporter substrate binding protein [Cupriavidus sp.]MCA3207285.1 tr
MLKIARIAAAALAVTAALGAHAQGEWPTKPVTIIVPFTPGGGTDIGTRLVAQRLSQIWSQPVVVDNRPGAAGNVGLELTARAKPDGYTLVAGNVGTQSINPFLYKKLNYKPDSFVPVTMMAELPFVLVVTPGLPAKTPKELVTLAKAKPGKLTFASSGTGGSPHLSGEIFKAATGTDMLHVPYKGGGAAMTDLMAGNVDMLFASILETTGHVKAGKLRALAVTGSVRSPSMPDVPTLAEAGIQNAESGSWVGLLAPAGTPKDIVDKIAADVKKVVAMPEVKKQLIEQGAIPVGSTPQQFAETIASDRKRYARIIADNHLSAD